MPNRTAGPNTGSVATHSDKVQQSREDRGLVNVMFSKHLRDSLRVIAGLERKTLIALMDEISEEYITAWVVKWRLSNKDFALVLPAPPSRKNGTSQPTAKLPARSSTRPRS